MSKSHLKLSPSKLDYRGRSNSKSDPPKFDMTSRLTSQIKQARPGIEKTKRYPKDRPPSCLVFSQYERKNGRSVSQKEYWTPKNPKPGCELESLKLIEKDHVAPAWLRTLSQDELICIEHIKKILGSVPKDPSTHLVELLHCMTYIINKKLNLDIPIKTIGNILRRLPDDPSGKGLSFGVFMLAMGNPAIVLETGLFRLKPLEFDVRAYIEKYEAGSVVYYQLLSLTPPIVQLRNELAYAGFDFPEIDNEPSLKDAPENNGGRAQGRGSETSDDSGGDNQDEFYGLLQGTGTPQSPKDSLKEGQAGGSKVLSSADMSNLSSILDLTSSTTDVTPSQYNLVMRMREHHRGKHELIREKLQKAEQDIRKQEAERLQMELYGKVIYELPGSSPRESEEDADDEDGEDLGIPETKSKTHQETLDKVGSEHNPTFKRLSTIWEEGEGALSRSQSPADPLRTKSLISRPTSRKRSSARSNQTKIASRDEDGGNRRVSKSSSLYKSVPKPELQRFKARKDSVPFNFPGRNSEIDDGGYSRREQLFYTGLLLLNMYDSLKKLTELNDQAHLPVISSGQDETTFDKPQKNAWVDVTSNSSSDLGRKPTKKDKEISPYLRTSALITCHKSAAGGARKLKHWVVKPPVKPTQKDRTIKIVEDRQRVRVCLEYMASQGDCVCILPDIFFLIHFNDPLIDNLSELSKSIKKDPKASKGKKDQDVKVWADQASKEVYQPATFPKVLMKLNNLISVPDQRHLRTLLDKIKVDNIALYRENRNEFRDELWRRQKVCQMRNLNIQAYFVNAFITLFPKEVDLDAGYLVNASPF